MSSLTNVSSTTIAFYIHHHGSGHIMRAITIAGAIKGYPICFLGSNLQAYSEMIPDTVECITLPMDLPGDNEKVVEEPQLSALHYSPLGVSGIRDRAAILTSVFQRSYPMLLVVDVSVEIALLARVAGIPTVVMRQHGNRTDLPHRLAYESAALLVAPFSIELAPPTDEEWVKNKTVFAGGFSRFSRHQEIHKCTEQPKAIAVLIGQGGTSINSVFINFLAASCSDYTFHIIGHVIPAEGKIDDNIKWHGPVADPLALLSLCTVVIGNAGHNTVMEMADLNKRFICIPEERPFDEQQQKADLLAKNGFARVVQPADLTLINWQDELAAAALLQPSWTGVTAVNALQHMAAAITGLAEQYFNK
jgi:predicted glycosyltransferase